MTKLSKTILIPVVIGLSAAIFWLALPWLRALILNYQFDQNVRVRIDVPRCSRINPHREAICCFCVVAFEGKRAQADLVLTGKDLIAIYSQRENVYVVSGNGTITDRKNTITLQNGHILLDGLDIPDSSIPFRVLLTKEGKLEDRYFDVVY